GRANFGLYTSLSFDLTVTSIFCSLTTGGILSVYRQDQNVEEVMRDYFREGSGNDSIKLTPSHINVLHHMGIRGGTVLRAIVGGEQVTPGHISILKRINPFMEI